KIWPEKHRLELEYVRNHSLWVDFKIMFLTLKTHLFTPLFHALFGAKQPSNKMLILPGKEGNKRHNARS
ncbi:MAG: hypothetical protein DRG83_18575, partial [Deltaproteobacteria bacterium]